MSCIVCKKFWVPGCARSFHKFPKDLARKQKWMEIIKISKVTSKSLVCSDHFTLDSYHQTDGYTTVRRLLSTAQPVINTNVKVLSDVTNEAITVQNNLQNENSNSTECTIIINSDGESNKIVDDCMLTNSINVAQTDIDKSISESEKGRLSTRPYPLNNVMNDNSTQEMCLVSNALNVKPLENINQVVSNVNRKRKNLGNDQESYPNKRFRFMDGHVVKSISRKDFKTDESWDTFMRYVAIQKSKNAVNRRNILRKKNKIKSFKDLINSLKGKETEASTKYLEVSCSIHC